MLTLQTLILVLTLKLELPFWTSTVEVTSFVLLNYNTTHTNF